MLFIPSVVLFRNRVLDSMVLFFNAADGVVEWNGRGLGRDEVVLVQIGEQEF